MSAQTARYLNHDDLTAELRTLADGSASARLSSVGTTLAGRDIWLVELGTASGPPLDERPGLLVVGNLEGDHVVGSSHAVEIVRHLLSGAEGTREVLDEQVVYVIPRLNPDAAEAMFDDVRWSRMGNARPFDDDNDGRIDEDGPEDLNGDGAITVMRVLDPKGPYMIDPDEPRLMKKADPGKGESGAYSLYWEGTDSDGDGFIAEDWAGGVDLDRNFQHEYPYYRHLAGPHMVSERESRALMDFMIAHRNIGAILTFGRSDNLVVPPNSGGALAAPNALDLLAGANASTEGVFDVGVYASGGGGFGGFRGGGFGGGNRLRGAQPGRDNDPSSGRRPAVTVNKSDIEYFKAVSDVYREVTGIEKIGVNRKAMGALFQYGYFQFGVPSFSTQGWELPAAADAEESGAGPGGAPDPARGGSGLAEAARGSAEPARARSGARGGRGAATGSESFDLQLLRGLESAGIEAFADWTAFTHPDLGEVEIGGFLPYVTTNPPESELDELGRAHGAFVVRLAHMLPRVRIAETEVTSHGGGVFTVEAEVENTGYFPTSLEHGQVSRSVQPTTLQIQIDPEDLITGAPKTVSIRQLAGSGGRARFTWVIRGRQGAQVEIRLRSQKGGSHSTSVTLR